MFRFCAFLCIAAFCSELAYAINVLVFVPGTSDMDRRGLNRIAQQMAFRNHGTATFKGVIIPEKKFLVKQKLHQVREISLKLGLDESIYGAVKRVGNEVPWNSGYETLAHKVPFWQAHVNACQPIVDSDLMEKLREDKYDVALVYAGNPCYLGLVHALSIPFIYYDREGFTDESVYAAGIPALAGEYPSSDSTYTTKMSFLQKIENLWTQRRQIASFSGIDILGQLFSPEYRLQDFTISRTFQDDYELKKTFPDFPNVNKIKQDAALYFVNSDPALEFTGRPLPQNVIFVGGAHIEYPKPLFDPYNTTNAGAKDGVILASLGNMANTSTMPTVIKRAFVETFKRMPDNHFYWHVGTEDHLEVLPEDLPANVNASVYMPQNDLLAAKTTKLLITNGGMNSIMEAIYHGVPIVGIPLVAPNYNNLRKVEAKGFGIILDKNDVNAESLHKAVREVLDNPKYRLAAKSISRAFKDRPMSPFETAIYWLEYVGRNRGAPFISSKSRPSLLSNLLTTEVALFLALTLVLTKLLWFCMGLLATKETSDVSTRGTSLANGHSKFAECDTTTKKKKVLKAK